MRLIVGWVVVLIVSMLCQVVFAPAVRSWSEGEIAEHGASPLSAMTVGPFVSELLDTWLPLVLVGVMLIVTFRVLVRLIRPSQA